MMTALPQILRKGYRLIWQYCTTNQSHDMLTSWGIRPKGKAFKFQIGTRNVRTLNQDGKLELLLDEIDRLHLYVVGLSEWKEKDLFNQTEIPRSCSLAVQVEGKKVELLLF